MDKDKDKGTPQLLPTDVNPDFDAVYGHALANSNVNANATSHVSLDASVLSSGPFTASGTPRGGFFGDNELAQESGDDDGDGDGNLDGLDGINADELVELPDVVVTADDEEEIRVEEADLLLSGEGAENATVKELQDAINVSRPFGLKLWKPALYKKERSINALTDSAIHEDPDDPSQKPITRFFHPGNLIWLIMFGWWISLVYLGVSLILLPFGSIGFAGLHMLSFASGIFGYRQLSTGHIRRQVESMVFSRDENALFRILAVVFFELERCLEYVLLMANFAWYMFWPFGKFIIRKRHPTRHFIMVPVISPQQTAHQDSLETTALLAQHVTGGVSSTAMNIQIHSDVESEYDAASIIWNEEDTDSEVSDSDSLYTTASAEGGHTSDNTEVPHGRTSRASGTSGLPSPPKSVIDSIKTLWSKVRESGPAGFFFRLVVFLILGPVHLLVCIVCYLGIFSLPMARLSYAVLSRLTKRRPLAVRACWGESRKAFGLTGRGKQATVSANKEFKIILCTNHAFGLRYYKFTIDGINIIILNLNAVVVFTLANFYVIGPLTNHTGIGSYGVIFLSALLSVIPLAYLIGMAVSSITAQTGSLALGAVVNATFGSIVEILLYCLALMQGKTKMVEGSIIGSFMAGLLALPGVSMFFGGLMRKEQKFNAKAAGVTSTLLIMAILGAFGPTFFQGVYGTFELQCVDCPPSSADSPRMPLNCRQCRNHQPHPTEDPIYIAHTRPLMYICATVLILMYGIGLLFTLRTHSKNIYPTEPKKKRQYRLSNVYGLRSERLGPSAPSAPPLGASVMSLTLPSPALHPHPGLGMPPNQTIRPRMPSAPKSPRDSARYSQGKQLPASGLGISHFSSVIPLATTPGGFNSGGGTSSTAYQQANGTHTHSHQLATSGAIPTTSISKKSNRTSKHVAQFNNGSVVTDSWGPSSRNTTTAVGLSSSSHQYRQNRYSSSSNDFVSTDDDESSTESEVESVGNMMDSMMSTASRTSAGVGAGGLRDRKGKGKISAGRHVSGLSTAEGSVHEETGRVNFTDGGGHGGATGGVSAKKKNGETSGGGGHGGHDHPNWSAGKSTAVLLLATLFFSMIAEVLIDCVDNVIDTEGGGLDGKWVVDEKILGLTLFAIVPTVTEFYNAIAFARQGNIALSLEIGSAYTIQVALLQIPTLVAFSTFWRKYGTPPPPTQHHSRSASSSGLLSEVKLPFRYFWRIYDAYSSGPNPFVLLELPKNKDTFTLVFPRWDVIAVLFGVFTVTYLYIEGKSNYFKGAMLLLAYGVLMTAFGYAPPELSMDS
ncbi:UNVERIFIED_CONTAM: hypothetical protein HDU68_004118 [Siphonaria sp. JEL0065]|nr:hypothetical protein HDU68_004118 [Siphonaria sp. JEL0065]